MRLPHEPDCFSLFDFGFNFEDLHWFVTIPCIGPDVRFFGGIWRIRWENKIFGMQC